MVEILPARLENAGLSRGGSRLFGPVNWTLRPGGLTAVIGPNGAGKTSLLRAIHGLERITSGRIRWPVPRATARAAQAFVFQTPVLMRRTVLDNVAFPLRLRGLSRAAARDQAQTWLCRVGLSDLGAQRARTLSGGERQKMALARALITAPSLLFLDEPTASLDGRATREVEDILKHARDSGTRILMATHDLGQARRIADEIVFLHHGHIVESGSNQDFFGGPDTDAARAFLKGDILE